MAIGQVERRQVVRDRFRGETTAAAGLGHRGVGILRETDPETHEERAMALTSEACSIYSLRPCWNFV